MQTNLLYQIKTHISCPTTPPPENLAVCEKMHKNVVEPYRPLMTIRRRRIACWIPKATNTHSVYVTLIAFLQQRWLRQSASILFCTFVACLVVVVVVVVVVPT